MTELILHIGAHKTATTALQRLLSESEKYLVQSGIIYPKIAWFQYAHHRLAFGFKSILDPVRGDLPDPMAEISELNAVLRNRSAPLPTATSPRFHAKILTALKNNRHIVQTLFIRQE